MILELLLYYFSFIEDVMEYSKFVGVDLFKPISTEDPGNFFQKYSHSRNTRDRMAEDDARSEKSIPTNKFYGNLLIDDGFEVWTHPYSVYREVRRTHNNNRQIYPECLFAAYDTQRVSEENYVYAWSLQHQICLTAKGFDQNTMTNVDSLEQASVNYNMFNEDEDGMVTFPLVQGMGFITGVYNNLVPQIKLAGSLSDRKEVSPGVWRYRIEGQTHTWAMYAFTENDTTVPEFKLTNGYVTTVDEEPCSVTIQLAAIVDDSLDVLDKAAGSYVAYAGIFGHINEDSATYGFNFVTKPEPGKKVLHFALPHHQESFDEDVAKTATDIYMNTVTKGRARGYFTEKFSFNELLDESLSFMPQYGFEVASSSVDLNNETVNSLKEFLTIELSRCEDFRKESENSVFYMSAKAIDKIAVLLLTARFVLTEQDPKYIETLDVLKDIFDKLVANDHTSALFYDTTHGGLVIAKGKENINADHGNYYYNNHHYQYGYIIHAAAVLVHIDPSWLEERDFRSWVNMLARDISNPDDYLDKYFTESRAFDWYHGHSWAKGLFESLDGKDVPSTSEDYHHMFGLMLWGKVTGDVSMEARARLILAIMKRSLNKYFLLASDNDIQDPTMVDKKVAGILYENKIDYTVYFDNNRRPEYIHGVHMLPVTAASEYIRPKEFVKEEMEEIFPGEALDSVKGGWRGILYNNYAISDPKKSYDYFKNNPYEEGLIDNGQSWSYALLYAALMGGQKE